MGTSLPFPWHSFSPYLVLPFYAEITVALSIHFNPTNTALGLLSPPPPPHPHISPSTPGSCSIYTRTTTVTLGGGYIALIVISTIVFLACCGGGCFWWRRR